LVIRPPSVAPPGKLLSFHPGGAAAVAIELLGVLDESLLEPGGDEVPADIQPFAADLGQRSLV